MAEASSEQATSGEEADAENEHSDDAEGGGDGGGVGVDAAHEQPDHFGDGEEGFLHGQDEAVAYFEHGEGEGEDGAGHEVGGDEGEGDAAKGAPAGGAEVGGGFLERAAGLLETGAGGSDDVGESTYRVADHEQEGGILAGVEPGDGEVEGGHVAEGDDQAGEGEREHGEGIQDCGEREASTGQQPGDGHAENEVERGAADGVHETVSDAAGDGALADEFGVMRGGEAVGRDTVEPAFGEGLGDDGEMGEDAAEHERTGGGPEDEGLAGVGGGDGAGGVAAGEHRVVIAGEDPFGDQEEPEREQDDEHDEGVAGGVGMEVGQGIVDLYRDDL